MTELTDAIAHLEWFTIPHTIEDCCRIARDLARDDARIRTGYRQVQRDIRRTHEPEEVTADEYVRIDYHDPTGDTAALNASPIIPVADATSILARLAAMDTATTGALTMLGLDTHAASVTPDGRLKALTADLRYIQTTGAPAALSAEQGLWQAFTREILTDAEWLHRKGEALWAQARHDQRQPAIAQDRRWCQSCARFGLEVEPELGRTECALCRNHKSLHGCRPTERTCRRWDHLGVKDTLPGEIMAAKAAVTRAAGKTRKAATA